MADKITLSNVSNLQSLTTSAATVNANNAAITTGMNNTLSRDGTAPNQMNAALDMNSHRIVNLPAPITINEPVRLVDLNTIKGGAPITVQPIPVGGTAGQVLNKNTNTDYDVAWTTPHPVPTGGTTGQVLTKSSGTDYATGWVSPIINRQGTYQIDLRDLMDARYGAGVWTQFGWDSSAGGSGIVTGHDATPALIDGLNQLEANADRRGAIYIPPGSFRMNSGLPANLLSGKYLLGSGSQVSKLVLCNANAVMLQWSGYTGLTGGGVKGVGLFLGPELSNTTSYGILLQGDSNVQPGQMMFEDVYMTLIGSRVGQTALNSYWYNGVLIDGSAKPTAPDGVRVGNITNMQIFNCRNAAFVMTRGVQWTLNNVGVFTGQNPTANTLIFNGTCSHVYGLGCNPNTTLNVTNCVDVWIDGVRYFA